MFVGRFLTHFPFSLPFSPRHPGSVSLFPPIASTGGASAASAASAATPQVNVNAPLGVLHGWLCKRHAKEKSMMNQWARRYFVVDDTRGTLSYMKSEHTKKASVVLPLVDISSVKEVREITPRSRRDHAEITPRSPHCARA